MARRLTYGPSMTVKGRKFKGLRGYAGKPFHPPLTDIPIAAYILAAVFDVASLIAKSGNHDVTARQLYVAAGWTMLAGAAVSVLAALTGFIDGYTSSEAGTQARRTINAHAVVMVTVTVLVLIELALRFFSYSDRGSTPGLIVVLSIIVALGVSFGATIGGTLVFDYGFNVETAGDHPAWHVSERDVYPADKDKPAGDVAG